METYGASKRPLEELQLLKFYLDCTCDEGLTLSGCRQQKEDSPCMKKAH